jgi:hypothetical protein
MTAVGMWSVLIQVCEQQQQQKLNSLLVYEQGLLDTQ